MKWRFHCGLFFFFKGKCIIKVAALFIREANEIITTVSEDMQCNTALKHCP